MESSISSFSDHDEIGDLELSLTKHDELFAAKSPRQQATSVEKKVRLYAHHYEDDMRFSDLSKVSIGFKSFKSWL